MSQSFDINTSYDALDDTTYDYFDVDAYCASLSPSVPDTESIPNTPTPATCPKRDTRTRGHPRPSPAVVPPPAVTSTLVVASTSSVSATASAKPGKPDKGKGRQYPAAAIPPASPMDTSSPAVSGESAAPELTPEQHLCFVRMLKRLNEWLAQGWQPGVDESCLRTLGEIFNAAESVAEGSISNIWRADLAWRLADSKGWEKSAGSSIMGAIDIQVTVTNILYKDYGESLITSFRSFLGQKEAELGSEGRPSGVSGPSLQKETGRGNLRPNVQKRVRFEGHLEELATYAQNGMKAADYLLVRRLPSFLHMMKRAQLSPDTLPLLAERLASSGSTFSSRCASLLPEPTLSIPAMPLVRSLTRRSPPLRLETNFDTFLQGMDRSPTPTLLEPTDAFSATPSDIGPQTMNEVVEQFMEDLLTQEFSPIVLDEDI